MFWLLISIRPKICWMLKKEPPTKAIPIISMTSPISRCYNLLISRTALKAVTLRL